MVSFLPWFFDFLDYIGEFFGVLASFASAPYSKTLSYFINAPFTSSSEVVFTYLNVFSGETQFLYGWNNFSSAVSSVGTLVSWLLGIVSQGISEFLLFLGSFLNLNNVPFVIAFSIVLVVFFFLFRLVKWIGTLFNPLKGN